MSKNLPKTKLEECFGKPFNGFYLFEKGEIFSNFRKISKMDTALKTHKKYTFEEYLELEKESQVRHEFHDGVLIPIEATTKFHNMIITNFILSADVPKLRANGCQLYHENVMTKLKEKKKYVYPDIVITCDKNDIEDSLIVNNPQIIVEILSGSTAKYDKAGKFFKYQRSPSLQQYFLISQYTYAVEYYLKTKEGNWLYDSLFDLKQKLILPSLNLEINLSDIYSGIQIEEED